jgi:hypothetical protein
MVFQYFSFVLMQCDSGSNISLSGMRIHNTDFRNSHPNNNKSGGEKGGKDSKVRSRYTEEYFSK